MPLRRRGRSSPRNSRYVQCNCGSDVSQQPRRFHIDFHLVFLLQAVADAYYVLSDTQRRREYDALLRTKGYRTAAGAGASDGASGGASGFGSTDPAASAAFFEQFRQYFSSAAAGAGAKTKEKDDASSDEDVEFEEVPPASSSAWNAGARPDAEGVFTDVFEELLRPEVQRTVNWWTYLGAASGAGLGFILANIPGALAGGLAGNRYISLLSHLHGSLTHLSFPSDWVLFGMPKANP